jgi:hypothetical protein
MTKKLMIGVAVGALMVSGALAQSPNSAPSSKANPPAAASEPSKSPAPAASASQPSGGKADFVTSQKPDQWLASNFKGTDVVGSDDKKIGDVSDVLFNKNGRVEAYVISVGGFLGMGAKHVALAPSSFEVVPGTQGGADKLKLSASVDELKQTQNFTPYQPPRSATTGSASPMGSSGALTGSARPSSNTPPTGK